MKIRLTEADVTAATERANAYDILDTTVDGLLVRVQPSGAKSYYVSYRLDGNRSRTRTKLNSCAAISLKDARAAAKIVLGKITRGENVNEDRRAAAEAKRATKITFKAFAEGAYATWAKAELKSHVSTLHRLQRRFGSLYNKRLCDLTPWNIEQWRSSRRKDGASPSTINRDLASLKSMLSKAVAWGELSVHPLAGVKLAKLDDNVHPRYLSPEEETRLLEALTLATTPDYLRILVLLALNTGCRRGELLHTTWQDIENNQLTVHGNYAKSGKTRTIPLNANALEALREWKQDSTHTDPDDWLFRMHDGLPLKDPKRSWSVLRKAAQLKGFRFHDLRHTFASKLVMAGVDLNTVRELLGHADIAMTLRYSHLAQEHKADAVNRLCASRPKQKALQVQK